LSDPPKINTQFFDIQPVTCYGKCNPGDGRATIITNGGTANNGVYFFTWQSGEIGNSNSNRSSAVRLCQGWQHVTVADANCFQVDSVWIPSPDSFSFATPRIILPTCNNLQDGSIDITVNGGTRPYRYQWNTGTSQTSYLPNVGAGNYQLTITDNNTCTFTFNLRVNQPDSLKIVVVDTATNAVGCFGEDNGRLTLRRTGGNAGGTTFQWSPNVSSSDIGVRLRAGVYSITATDEKGCRDSMDYIVSQPDPIYFQMPRPIPPRCNGAETDITIDTAFGSYFRYPFVFSVDNFPPLTLRGRFPVYAGNHQVSIIETVSGCRFDTIIRIIEPPAIRIDFDSIANNPGLTRLSVGLGDSIRLNPRVYNDDNTRVVIDSIAWSPNRYLSFDAVGGQLRPFSKPLDDITYTLRIFDINGCLSEEFVTIELDRNRNIFIPSIFTPNNDDKNDVFSINAGEGVTKINYFRVFNRWGGLVFERQGILPNDDKVASGWDGTFNGRPLLPDVYVYIAEIVFEDGKVLLYRGDVTLIR
jgi:gliding motility-associated-like protein